MNELELQITTALGPYRAPFDGGRSGSPSRQGGSQISKISHAATWSEDYGPGKATQKATMDAARLALVSSGDYDGSGSASGKSRLDNSRWGIRKNLWSTLDEHLCNGTKVLAVCLGLVAFIVVI